MTIRRRVQRLETNVTRNAEEQRDRQLSTVSDRIEEYTRRYLELHDGEFLDDSPCQPFTQAMYLAMLRERYVGDAES